MNDIINKITHGMYIVTTQGGGCVVDAVCQISAGDNPLISISINKNNNTNALLHKNENLVLSLLSPDVDGKTITNFGFHSSRNYDKFLDGNFSQVEGIKVPNDIMGYIYLKIEDKIENETHTLFIARVVSGKLLKETNNMTYNYYREHKEEYIKVKTENNKTAWVCTICGYVYYGEELPENFVCPKCGVGKELFKKMEQ